MGMRMSWLRPQALLAFCLVLLSTCGQQGAGPLAESAVNAQPENADLQDIAPHDLPSTALLVYVADGDTFTITSIAGQYTVRLLGVDTPELGVPEEALAQQAQTFVQQTLAQQVLLLEYDTACHIKADDCFDIYGRLLAYVRAAEQPDLGAMLLEQGLAEVFNFQNQGFDQLADYTRIQHTAQNAQLGLWAD